MNQSSMPNIFIDNIKENAMIMHKYLYLFIKRIFDIICGLVGCILLIPIVIIVKISYLLNGDTESIIYSHERIGKNGKLFRLYKFRSMVPNADKILEELLKDTEIREQYKKNMKLKDDPRITKMGKFLRKASLDEAPQFVNVLLGQMSLIGNRPYLPREKEDMGEYYRDIILSKPGITGYWQTAGRSKLSFKNRLKLESYYSKNMSLWMDIKIFFKTFSVVFCGRGAC